jgi:hypothetical protein
LISLATAGQPWRDVLGAAIVSEMFVFIFAWSRWTDDQRSLVKGAARAGSTGARRRGGFCR